MGRVYRVPEVTHLFSGKCMRKLLCSLIETNNVIGLSRLRRNLRQAVNKMAARTRGFHRTLLIRISEDYLYDNKQILWKTVNISNVYNHVYSGRCLVAVIMSFM